MDWQKVIDNLREQSNYYAKRANEFGGLSGHYDSVKEMRASANVASILASALYSGLLNEPPEANVAKAVPRIHDPH